MDHDDVASVSRRRWLGMTTGPAMIGAMGAALASSALADETPTAKVANPKESGARVFNGASDTLAQSMFVLESTVQRSANRARVNVRLVDPDPTVPVWVYQVDFAVDSVFAAQDELAARVVQAVSQAQLRRRG